MVWKLRLHRSVFEQDFVIMFLYVDSIDDISAIVIGYGQWPNRCAFRIPKAELRREVIQIMRVSKTVSFAW